MSFHFSHTKGLQRVALVTLTDLTLMLAEHLSLRSDDVSIDLAELHLDSCYMTGESKFAAIMSCETFDDGTSPSGITSDASTFIESLGTRHVGKWVFRVGAALVFLSQRGAVPTNEDFLLYYDW